MREVKELLKKQNEILKQNQKLVSDSIGEFIRLLKLQSAESRVTNSRLDMMQATQEKLLIGISHLGETSKTLLDELMQD